MIKTYPFLRDLAMESWDLLWCFLQLSLMGFLPGTCPIIMEIILGIISVCVCMIYEYIYIYIHECIYIYILLCIYIYSKWSFLCVLDGFQWEVMWDFQIPKTAIIW